MKNKLLNFIDLNKQKLTVVFIMYAISTISIGVVNYPYIDDIARRIEGVANFAAHYSRYLSEFASYLVQGSRHLTDTGLTTFILSAFILTVTSASLLFILFDGKKVSWISAIGSVFIGINPWFLEPISFRFDGPYIALSVLVSTLPFFFYYSKKTTYFFLSALGVFLMCNSYQGSSGIYIVMLLTLIYKDFLNASKVKEIFQKIVISFFAYSSGIGAYYLETKFNPELALRGDTTSIASLNNMPMAVIQNLQVYFKTIRYQSTRTWFILALLAIVLTIIYMSFNSKINKTISFILGLVYVVTAAIFSFGVYMFFSTPLADDRPRYAYGFAFFLGILLILLGGYIEKRVFSYLKGAVVLLLMYYAMSFSFIYSSALQHQKDAFEDSSVLLAEDLNDYITQENQVVYISSLFKDSQVFTNTASSYPILKELIPSNANLYWPNLLWFNTLTNLNINLVGFDFNTIDISTLELLESNKLWDIYQLDGDIYVYTK
ncbi:glucosyltransferase domain-containing protein [Streptococcus henryi]|uniref:glucosyltransferase domain-containing protein n=1 Tax=Streptococcus henryi TaxID=439219 RepID=UPI0003607878|nr:glucosyltransferase domain-containing protein [Streptococcus henryi]